jgi:hypothetical protein
MRWNVARQKKGGTAQPHLSELDEAVFGKRSQGRLAKDRKNPKPTDKGTTIGILHENQKPCTRNLAWKDFAKGINHAPLPSLKGEREGLIPPAWTAAARGGRCPDAR